jgi:hypothetical protein
MAIDMWHGQGHAQWRRTGTIEIDMQREHGHAAWTWTSTYSIGMDVDMQHGHGHGHALEQRREGIQKSELHNNYFFILEKLKMSGILKSFFTF